MDYWTIARLGGFGYVGWIAGCAVRAVLLFVYVFFFVSLFFCFFSFWIWISTPANPGPWLRGRFDGHSSNVDPTPPIFWT